MRTRLAATGKYTTLVLGCLAALIPLGELADATSIGTLCAFALVNLSVIYLRRARPELTRSYRVPFYPLVPLAGFAMCVLLMITLGGTTWFVFGIWMLIGTGLYFLYGRKHSVVGAMNSEQYADASDSSLSIVKASK